MKFIFALSSLTLVSLSGVAPCLAVNQNQSFEKWCLQKNSLPSETQHTIKMLLEIVRTKDCKLADSKLNSFTGLKLTNSNIRDVKPLGSFVKWKALNLSGNYISDIKPLAGLTNLTVLGLDDNEISDVNALVSLKKLTMLSLNGNPISNVSALAALTRLTNLYLLDTTISPEICPVKPVSVCEFE